MEIHFFFFESFQNGIFYANSEKSPLGFIFNLATNFVALKFLPKSN